MSDITIRQDVIDALEFDPSLDAEHIGVAVEAGVVTLTGHVRTYSEKIKAEEITGRVKGVRGMAQEIEVRPIGAHKTADDEIARRALQTLFWSTTVPENGVKVKVTRGWVTLTGDVDWHYQRESAEHAVRNLSGVTGIDNQIKIRPRVSEHDVRDRIVKALKRQAEVDASAIGVDVAEGTVVLKGKVHSWTERYAAEQAAWAVPGVSRVDDRLTVS